MRHGKRPMLTGDVWEHAYCIDYRNAHTLARTSVFAPWTADLNRSSTDCRAGRRSFAASRRWVALLLATSPSGTPPTPPATASRMPLRRSTSVSPGTCRTCASSFRRLTRPTSVICALRCSLSSQSVAMEQLHGSPPSDSACHKSRETMCVPMGQVSAAG
jgi:hypothetical protein